MGRTDRERVQRCAILSDADPWLVSIAPRHDATVNGITRLLCGGGIKTLVGKPIGGGGLAQIRQSFAR